MREMEIPFQVKKPTIPCQNSNQCLYLVLIWACRFLARQAQASQIVSRSQPQPARSGSLALLELEEGYIMGASSSHAHRSIGPR